MGLFARFAAWRDARDQNILGVPARIMWPRLVLIGVTVALIALGLVMVFSASSIKGILSDNEDPSQFFTKQLMALAGGLVLAGILVAVRYERWSKNGWVVAALIAIMLLLVVVRVVGTTAGGATRWISVAGFTLQPSELAKPVLIVAGAVLADHYARGWRYSGAIDFELVLGGAIVVCIGLILIQPDKGTTLILCATGLYMAYEAGVPARAVIVVGALGLVAFFGYSLTNEYSRNRLMAMFNVEATKQDLSYQLYQGFYAFGSGGLFGVGLGNSRQKYSYLPEAHNDFIFAVIGEELGLVGCLAVLAAFALLLWAGLKIAQNAPDRKARFIASGIAVLFTVQVLLNVMGVLGLFPLSGKAVPFLSYGGSSLITSVVMVGILLSISRSSHLPVTEADKRRSQMHVVGASGGAARDGGASAGSGRAGGFGVLVGGRSASAGASRRGGSSVRRSGDGRAARAGASRGRGRGNSAIGASLANSMDAPAQGKLPRVNVGQTPAERFYSTSRKGSRRGRTE